MSPGEVKEKAVKTLPRGYLQLWETGLSQPRPWTAGGTRRGNSSRSHGTARQKAEREAGQSEAGARPDAQEDVSGSPSHARPQRARGFPASPARCASSERPAADTCRPRRHAGFQSRTSGRREAEGSCEGRRGSTFALEGAVGVLAVLLGAAGRRLRRTLVHIWNRTRSCERQARPPPGQSWPPDTAHGQGWPGGHALMAVLGGLLLGWGRGPWCQGQGRWEGHLLPHGLTQALRLGWAGVAPPTVDIGHTAPSAKGHAGPRAGSVTMPPQPRCREDSRLHLPSLRPAQRPWGQGSEAAGLGCAPAPLGKLELEERTPAAGGAGGPGGRGGREPAGASSPCGKQSPGQGCVREAGPLLQPSVGQCGNPGQGGQ